MAVDHPRPSRARPRASHGRRRGHRAISSGHPVSVTPSITGRSPESGDDHSPSWPSTWTRPDRCRTETDVEHGFVESSVDSAPQLPDYVQVPEAACGPPLTEQGYFVCRVERNLFWVTDGTYQSAFLATPDGVVLFDAPPTIGHNLRRAEGEAAAAERTTNTVTHLVYSHPHPDHPVPANLFGSALHPIGATGTRPPLLADTHLAR